MSPTEHPDNPPRPGRWNVMVTSLGVRGCTGSYRWRWRARLKARSNERFWPLPKTVEVMYMPDPTKRASPPEGSPLT